MVSLLIDTSIFIDHFRQPNKHTKLSSLPHPYKRFTSSLVVFELERGLSMSKQKTQKLVKSILETYIVLPYTSSTAQIAGKLDRDQLIKANDAMIAATCLEHNLTLVTINSKHFIKVPNLKLYQFTA